MNAWKMWDDKIHAEDKQKSKQKKAVSSECKPIKLDRENCSAVISGSEKGQFYETDLIECTCISYKRELVPCKHMYRLAYELGLMNAPLKLEYGYKKIEALSLFDTIEKDAGRLFNSISSNPIGEYFVINNSSELQQLISIGFVEICEDEIIRKEMLLKKTSNEELYGMCQTLGNPPSKKSKKDVFIKFILENNIDLSNYNPLVCVNISKNIDGLINSIIKAYHTKYPTACIEDDFFI